MDNLKRLFVGSELKAAVHSVIGKQWIEDVELDEMVYVLDNCSYSTFKALLEIDNNYGYGVVLKLISVTHNGEPIEIDNHYSSEIKSLARQSLLDVEGDGCDYPYSVLEC